MALAKNTLIFNLSNPNFHLSFGSPNKLSRLCFISLPKHARVMKCKSAGRNTAERNNDGNEDWRWTEEEGNPEPKSETKEKAKENAQKGKTREGVKRETEKGKERAMEGAHKAAQTAEGAKEKAGERNTEAKETLRNVKDSTKLRVKEKAEGASETMADTAKEGAVKVTDTVQKIGKKAKNTMKDVWGAAKETTHKIKETVLGPDEQVDDDERDGDVDVVVMDNSKREEDANDAKKKDLGQKKRSGKSDEKN